MKAFLLSVVLIVATLIPACRTKTTPTPKIQPDTMATVAPLPPPVPTMTVEPTTDFVKTDTTVTEEQLPTDLDELNRMAQQRGYLQDAFFSYDQSALSSEAQAALTSSATWLRNKPEYNVLIEGHCDERGTEQYNLALGDHRANTAKEFIAALGVDARRIRTVSYGEERPFDSGHDESGWAKNRRAHLVLVGK